MACKLRSHFQPQSVASSRVASRLRGSIDPKAGERFSGHKQSGRRIAKTLEAAREAGKQGSNREREREKQSEAKKPRERQMKRMKRKTSDYFVVVCEERGRWGRGKRKGEESRR